MAAQVATRNGKCGVLCFLHCYVKLKLEPHMYECIQYHRLSLWRPFSYRRIHEEFQMAVHRLASGSACCHRPLWTHSLPCGRPGSLLRTVFPARMSALMTWMWMWSVAGMWWRCALVQWLAECCCRFYAKSSRRLWRRGVEQMKEKKFKSKKVEEKKWRGKKKSKWRKIEIEKNRDQEKSIRCEYRRLINIRCKFR